MDMEAIDGLPMMNRMTPKFIMRRTRTTKTAQEGVIKRDGYKRRHLSRCIKTTETETIIQFNINKGN